MNLNAKGRRVRPFMQSVKKAILQDLRRSLTETPISGILE